METDSMSHLQCQIKVINLKDSFDHKRANLLVWKDGELGVVDTHKLLCVLHKMYTNSSPKEGDLNLLRNPK